jgi:hypothetical protein
MKKILIGLAVVAIGVGLYYYFSQPQGQPQENTGITAPNSGEAITIIGTKSGTSTVGATLTTAYTGGNKWGGTTTYPIFIGTNINNAVFTFKATMASSSGSFVTFNVLGSNDFGCDASSSVYSAPYPIVKNDINWFDAGYNVLNLAGSASLSATNTTYVWSPTGPANTQITLTNLNAKCLLLKLNATTTALWAQVKVK